MIQIFPIGNSQTIILFLFSVNNKNDRKLLLYKTVLERHLISFDF